MKRFSTLILALTSGLFLAFQGQAQTTLTINSPGGLAGLVSPIGNTNETFGGDLGFGESVTGDIAISLTANPDSLGKWQACESLINPAEVAGKVALVRRGVCPFADKIWFAQEAGAIAVIICNNVESPAVIGMLSSGDYMGLDTIPAVMITLEKCEEILAAINNGDDVNVTFEGPSTFYDAAMSYSYHTPIDHIIPMDVIRVRMVNPSASDLANITVTCDIEDPDGVITTLETTYPLIAPGADSLIFLPEFTPTKLGEYTGTFTNSVTADVLTEKFVITENLFATDRGNVTTANNRQDLFEANQTYRYHYGNLYQTVNPGIATHISFGIGNAPAVFADNPDFDLVNVVLYNGDADNDGNLDFSGTPSFDDLSPVGLGTYLITGNEGAQEILTTEILSITGADFITINADGAYYAVIKYDGDATSATTCPSFIGSDYVPYGTFTTCLYLGATFYNAGWADASVLARLHVDETPSSTDNLAPLDKAQARVFPNPTSEFVNLELDLQNPAQEVRLDLINFDSRVVGSYKLQNVQKGTFDFSIAHLPAGVYFFSVKTPEGYRSIPFTVIR
jgi:hypothetical protein